MTAALAHPDPWLRPALKLMSSPEEDSNPAHRIRPMSDPPETTPTEAAPPDLCDTLPPDADDAAAEGRMRTILPLSVPVKELINASDSMIGTLIAEIAQAARLIMQERDERAEAAKGSAQNQQRLITQQEEIISILRKTETSTDANYKLILQHIKTLEASDAQLDTKLTGHGDRIQALESMIEQLRGEIMESLPDALRVALEPYVARIEALEREAQELRKADAAGTTKAPAG